MSVTCLVFSDDSGDTHTLHGAKQHIEQTVAVQNQASRLFRWGEMSVNVQGRVNSWVHDKAMLSAPQQSFEALPRITIPSLAAPRPRLASWEPT